MDQTTPEVTEVDEFYANYVKEKRERDAREETTIPATVTCHVDLDADVCDALLDLIAQNKAKYSLRSQAFLARASKSIEVGMLLAAETLANAQSSIIQKEHNE